MIDTIPAAFVAAIVIGLVDPAYLDSPDSTYAITWLAFLVWIPLEAFLMSTWGTTPGKALFRTRVVSPAQTSLTFGAALNRAGRVWLFGMGTGFPLVALFTMARAHGRLTREGTTSWDRVVGTVVHHQPVGTPRAVVAVLIIVALTLLSLVPM